MNTHPETPAHPLTEGRAWDIYSDAHPVDAIRAAFDAGRKYQDDLEDDTIRNIMKDVHHLRVERDTADNVVADLTARLDAERFAHANTAVKVKNVEDLADRLDNEAAYEASRGDTWDATCIRAEARRIRRALNGDDR